jgi:hypothetical protein
MSVISALSAYRNLNAEQKKFLREKKIEATYPPDAWIALLSGAVRYDQAGDPLRKAMGWTAGISLVIMFISLVGGALPLSLVFLVIGIAAIVVWVLLRRIDIPDSVRGFLLPTVTLLREDIQPEGMLHMKVDLTGGTQAGKKKESRDLPGRGGASIVQSIYNDPWMMGDSTLADGSALQWEITDNIRERKVTRRNPRGKIKTKFKYRVRRLIDVRVGLRRDDYAVEAGGQAADSRLQMNLKPGEKRNVIRMRKVVESSSLNSALDVHEFLDPIAAAYSRATLVKTEGKS